MPLVDDAIDGDLAIAAYSDRPLPALPAEVEIGASPGELVKWADYIAVDVQSSLIASLRELLGGEIRFAAEVEMLVDMALPCGLGICGACAALSRNGWKLACQDGPVFQWNEWTL
jgi:dihydroorotate dehydrogenase electron transfer subunit